MSKTSITIRIDDSVLQKIDSKCDSEQCCRTDYIKKAISQAIESEKKVVQGLKIRRVSYDDGKTWIDLE